MICPKCQGPHLETTPVRGWDFTVERCSRCKGIWFDMMEAEHLKEIKDSEKISAFIVAAKLSESEIRNKITGGNHDVQRN